MNRIGLSVYCLVPYLNKKLYNAVPRSKEEARIREYVYAFKNGRAMYPEHGGHSLVHVIGTVLAGYAESPLAKTASETGWVPVPRSGASQPSSAPNSDTFPCSTLAKHLANRFGSAINAYKSFERTTTLQQDDKHKVEPNIKSLKLIGPTPHERSVVLVDDMVTTGSTLVACALMLRDRGYRGNIAAFCVAYDVDPRDADNAQPPNREWSIRWAHPHARPLFEPVRTWG